MNVSDYYGELVVTGGLTPRWRCWFVSMISFLYLVPVLVFWPECYIQCRGG